MSTDYIGIDFGTSNCAVAAFVDQKPTLIVVDESSENPYKIRSAIYLTQDDSGNDSQDANENEQTLNEMLTAGEIMFGEKGFNAFIETPNEGRYVNSPKNFLGAKITKRMLDSFETLVVRFLSYLKKSAETQLNTEIKKAVIARPVNYHSTMGELGNKQAEALMLRAANKAGFIEVDFIHEPLAAAYHFEQSIKQKTNALVVDLGGGTSDVSFCELSEENAEKIERDEHIFSTDGIRQGGIVCDKSLANGIISPLFGRGGRTVNEKAIPNMLFSGVYDIDNIPLMADFYSPIRSKAIKDYILDSKDPLPLTRLQRVQTKRLTHQLMHGIEKAKIDLSNKSETALSLSFIDNNLMLDIGRHQVSETMVNWLSKMFNMIEDSIKKANKQPDIIYLTGGMGLSPLVQEAIKNKYPNIQLTVADAFSSVVFGALLKAKKVFSS